MKIKKPTKHPTAAEAAQASMLVYVGDGHYDGDRAKAERWAVEHHRQRYQASCGVETFLAAFRSRLDAADRFAAYMGSSVLVGPVVARGAR